MAWEIDISKRVSKQIAKLPVSVLKNLKALIKEIEVSGPVRGNWSNYSRLGGNRHHCHIKKGKPTYVAVWAVENKKVKLVEVIYAGTHEKAPY
jgi:mRNA-degrading endonuclease RelE of RelBE toxin-antitoxin system